MVKQFQKFRSSALHSSLNTNAITRLGICKVCNEAVHCEEEKVVELIKHCKKLLIRLYPWPMNVLYCATLYVQCR